MAARDGRRSTCTYASLGIAVSPLTTISHILYLFSKTAISESIKGQKMVSYGNATADGNC